MGFQKFFQDAADGLLNLAESIGFKDTIQNLIEKFPYFANDEIRRAMVIKKVASYIGKEPQDFKSSIDSFAMASPQDKLDITLMVHCFVSSVFGKSAADEMLARSTHLSKRDFLNEVDRADIPQTASLAFILGIMANNKTLPEIIHRQRVAIFTMIAASLSDPLDTIDIKAMLEASLLIGVRTDEIGEVGDEIDGKDKWFDDTTRWLISFIDPEYNVDGDDLMNDVVTHTVTEDPVDMKMVRSIRAGMGDSSVLGEIARSLKM